MPVLGDITWLPNRRLTVVVREIVSPLLSAVTICDVPCLQEIVTTVPRDEGLICFNSRFRCPNVFGIIYVRVDVSIIIPDMISCPLDLLVRQHLGLDAWDRSVVVWVTETVPLAQNKH